MVDEVVAGESKKLPAIGKDLSPLLGEGTPPKVAWNPLPESPIQIAVEFLTSCIDKISAGPTLTWNIISILLVADVGVIDTERPVISTYDPVLDVEKVSVLVVLTTCNTDPVGNLALPKVPLEMLDALVAVDDCVVASLNVRPFVPSTTKVMLSPKPQCGRLVR